METDIWKDIIGFEEFYEIKDGGIIRNKKTGKIPSGQLNYYGYRIHVLCRPGIKKLTFAHRALFEAFVGLIPKNRVIDHINHIPTDNRLCNLQMITNRENCSKDRIGPSGFTGVSWDKMLKKWRASIHIKGKKKFLGSSHSAKEASELYQNALNLLSE